MYIRTFVTSGYSGAERVELSTCGLCYFFSLSHFPAWKIIIDDCLSLNVQSVVFILQHWSSFRKLYGLCTLRFPQPLGFCEHPQNLSCSFCQLCSSHLQLRVLPLLNSHYYLYFLGKVLIFMFQRERQFNLLLKVLCYQISDYLTPNSCFFSPIKIPSPYMKVTSNFFLSFLYLLLLSPLPFQDSLCEE